MHKYKTLTHLIFATINALFALLGVLFLTSAAGMDLSGLNSEKGPYTSYFYMLYTIINTVFVILIGVSAYLLFRIRPSGIRLLSLVLKGELVYWILISTLWFFFPKNILISAVTATGIGNVGIGAQLFIMYPITGLMSLWILKKFNIINNEQ